MSGRSAPLVLFLAAAASCSFQRRSSEYACDTPTDCGAGRTCDNGWCVEIGGPTIDADPDAPDADPNQPDGAPADAFVCPPPPACSFCDELNTCVITCNAGNPCNTAPVVCPAGQRCKIECLTADTCDMGIDCSNASNCRIECGGSGACGGPITCGEGPCTIECTNTGTCTGGINCADSCQCSTDCSGAGSCMPAPICPAPPQCSNGDVCLATHPNCMTCGA